MRTVSQGREVQRTVPAPATARGLHLVPPLRINLQRIRPMSPDIAWAVFVGINLAAMRLIPAWQTVPFLAIWVSLTVIYGFRLWRLQPTILTLRPHDLLLIFHADLFLAVHHQDGIRQGIPRWHGARSGSNGKCW